jgi:HEAT repeat protein
MLTLVLTAAWLSPSVVIAQDDSEAIIQLVMDELKSGDPERQTGAIAIVRDIPGEAITKALADELPTLSPAIQVQVLSTLADRGDARALPGVVKASEGADESVRVAALKAVGQLGNASSIPLLAQRAAETRGQEQKAARDSLYRLRGADIGAAILTHLAAAEANVKVELIRAVGERNITDGVEPLLGATKDENRKVRLAAFKVLKVIAGPDDLEALVDRVLDLAGESDRNEAEKMVAAVAHKIEDPTKQAAPVLMVLPKVEDVKNQASLLRILGRIGDSTALPKLRAALTQSEKALQDAALRALTGWPTPEPVPDLLKVAQTSENKVHEVLALRGFVRLLGLASDRPAAETVALYNKAMDLAPSVSEKKRVLSGVGGAASLPALEMASGYLDDSALHLEAESAIVRLARDIHAQHKARCREALTKVITNTKNETIRIQAQEVLDRLEGREPAPN